MADMELDNTNSIWAIVRMPCSEERFAARKLQRLALEVKLAFGEHAQVLDPEANVIEPLRK